MMRIVCLTHPNFKSDVETETRSASPEPERSIYQSYFANALDTSMSLYFAHPCAKKVCEIALIDSPLQQVHGGERELLMWEEQA